MSVLSRRSTVEELLAQVPTNEEGSNAAVILLGSLTTFSFDGSQPYGLGMTWLFAFSLQDFKDGFSGVVVRWYATFETAGERTSLGSLLAGTKLQISCSLFSQSNCKLCFGKSRDCIALMAIGSFQSQVQGKVDIITCSYSFCQ